jgi:alpha-L-fucosidase
MSTSNAWFRAARLGLFIHWGLYSLPARHSGTPGPGAQQAEWIRTTEPLSDEHYTRYFRHFEPDLFDAAEWAALAKRAGMRYAVLTTKHHDGFCLWDTDLTDYKVTNTPHGRDIVAEYVDAFRAEGLHVGLYHSLIDWHHPDFPIDGIHPQRDDAEAKRQPRDIAGYRAYLHGQVRELLTGYGDIDYLFFDFSYDDPAHRHVWGPKGAQDWASEDLLALVRELQPGVLVNDRLGIPGDFVTPEQYQPAAPMTVDGKPVAWEACQTLNGSWGYDRDNIDFKAPDTLVRMLVDSVAKDGNLLLNVGPTSRGEIDTPAQERLEEIGAWMRGHGRAIRGCGATTLAPPPDCRYTRSDNRIYVHVFAWPHGHLHLPELAGKVEYAQLLNDGSELQMTVVDPDREASLTTMGGLPAGTLTLELPTRRPDVAVPVIELFLSSEAAVD